MNIIKNITTVSVLALIAIVALSNTSVVRAEESQSVVAPTPASGGSNSAEGSTALVPSNGGSNSSETGTSLVPSNSGSNGAEGGTTLVPTVGSSNGNEGGSTSSTGGTSSSGSFGGGTALISGSVLGTTTGATTTSAVASSSCPLISTFMTLGGSNNGSEVAKLQAFLKNSEKMNVAVTGIYDAQTFEAVKAFQAKYLNDTMGPWAAAVPSGRVYITTLKKINQLACAAPLSLSADEIAIIEAYKAKKDQAPAVTGSDTGSNTSSTTDMIGQNNNESNTAAAANASVVNRFWNFLKNIF